MLCAAFGAAALLAILVVSGAWPVAMAFGLMAAYLPVALVVGRGSSRASARPCERARRSPNGTAEASRPGSGKRWTC